jgi:hypothetical protein
MRHVITLLVVLHAIGIAGQAPQLRIVVLEGEGAAVSAPMSAACAQLSIRAAASSGISSS